MFLAKSRAASEVQTKPRESALSNATSSAAAAHEDGALGSAPDAPAPSSGAPSAPPTPLIPPSDELAFEHALNVPSGTSLAPGLPSTPIHRHAAHVSIFSSPLASPQASSAADTALLSAQLLDLRRRLAECERDKDASSREHASSMREALDAAAAVRLELQHVRDQNFEDSEALRFQHQQALDVLGDENMRLQQANCALQAAKADIEQRSFVIETELEDTKSRLEVAQKELSEQTALCSRSHARQEELQSVISAQTREISSLSSSHSSSLVAFQQRECDFQEKIRLEGAGHEQEVGDLRSQIATLSSELQRHKSALTLSSLQQESEISRSSCIAKCDGECAAAAAEVAALQLLLQQSADNAAVSLSKLQSDCNIKEQELAAARQQLVTHQAALAAADARQSNLNLQVQSLQVQLSHAINKEIQERTTSSSSSALASPGDSTALELANRRIAEIERK
jgi:hypothetical protein